MFHPPTKSKLQTSSIRHALASHSNHPSASIASRLAPSSPLLAHARRLALAVLGRANVAAAIDPPRRPLRPPHCRHGRPSPQAWTPTILPGLPVLGRASVAAAAPPPPPSILATILAAAIAILPHRLPPSILPDALIVLLATAIAVLHQLPPPLPSSPPPSPSSPTCFDAVHPPRCPQCPPPPALSSSTAPLSIQGRTACRQALVLGFASAIPVFADTAGASIHRRRIGTALSHHQVVHRRSLVTVHCLPAGRRGSVPARRCHPISAWTPASMPPDLPRRSAPSTGSCLLHQRAVTSSASGPTTGKPSPLCHREEKI
uniref:Uncharacterized protein n=1 Tax=Oryza meridionalis TaxID=40149 RepID=A0A0E0D5J7_9ORYZ